MEVAVGQAAALVMDDDEDVRFIAEYMLKNIGFAVVPTATGSEAIACYAAELRAGRRFLAVILDSNIPGSMGGREVLGKLKELDPQVNAFITSGNPFDPMMIDPKAFGFAGAIPKPFTTDCFLKLLAPKR